MKDVQAWCGRRGDAARLVVQPFTPLGDVDAAAVADEGRRLLAFAEPDATRHHVEVGAPTRSSR